MKERRERNIFTPGMQCPGGCGRALASRDDLYGKLVMCHPCGAKYRNEYQRSTRYSGGMKCACGARIENRSTRCRKCSMREVSSRPPEEKPGGAAPNRAPAVFAGLRGDGGEMAAVLEIGVPYRARRWGAGPC